MRYFIVSIRLLENIIIFFYKEVMTHRVPSLRCSTRTGGRGQLLGPKLGTT